jgi:peptidoglycan/LPS O-acetylase OafA/YrhL
VSFAELQRWHSSAAPGEATESAVTHRGAYWPEIDGLRMIAVLAVIAFHLDSPLLGGGFVGVDIFFVISGFLITTLLANEIDGGSFSILRFYQRRIARIAPAAFLVVAVTLLAGALWYSAQDFASLGANALAAVFAVINFKLILQGNYFEISPDAQPLVHYWSLAVEEQFYLLFPIFLYGVMTLTRRPLAMLVGCCLISFMACVLLTLTVPVAAFYLLPTRAWELLAGSALAIARKRYGELGAERSSLCLLAGIVFIGLSFVLVREQGFPGWIAALPVAGATLALAGIGTSRGGAPALAGSPGHGFRGQAILLALSLALARLLLHRLPFLFQRCVLQAGTEDRCHDPCHAADLSFHRKADAALAERPSTPRPSLRRVGRGGNRARRGWLRDSNQLLFQCATFQHRQRRHYDQSARTRMDRSHRRQPRLDVRL